MSKARNKVKRPAQQPEKARVLDLEKDYLSDC
jgi:hypothetical protein